MDKTLRANHMKLLTRPWILATAALAIGAAALLLRSSPAQPKPTPSAVAPGDHEIVWLANTTTASAWERFVAAVQRAARRIPGLKAEITDAAFPPQTTAVPEVALDLPDGGGRLVFRWYKVTTDWKTSDWIEALLKRRPPPLAVIGGSSSDAALELARQLRRQTARTPKKDRPLLLLTTATADRVTDPDAPAGSEAVELTRLYPNRTFRFCFTNRQMASALMSFLRSREEFQLDLNSVHMVQWDDDSYSHDLIDGFEEVLHQPGLRGSDDDFSDKPLAPILTNQMRVQSSVGSFLTPNRYEAEVVGQVVQDLEAAQGERPLEAGPRNAEEMLRELEGKRPRPRRPLLVVTGQSAPSRRFLGELARTAPAMARRLVVATGDSIGLNTVYRDRRVAWPIQDLPFEFVFFCHYDPIQNDAADPDLAFLPEGQTPPEGEEEFNLSSTGTEDVLLNGAVVESLVQAFDRDGRPAADADELNARLGEIRRGPGGYGYDPLGAPLFGPDGDRRGGADENLVYLQPHFEGDRVLPEATMQVWVSRESAPEGVRSWNLRGRSLTVSYSPPVVEERSGP
jgi:hypothetical protein